MRFVTTGSTEANELLQAVHHRMPVILTREGEATWLDPNIQDHDKLLPLLRQYLPEEMDFYPVSRQVNSPAVDEPKNIERMA